MKLKTLLAASLLVAMLASLAPAPRALADGAASTRNILLGVGAAAATLIIVNHNKKVHEKYAEDARKEAALASQRDDARAAYNAELRAYRQEVAVADSLKAEIAVKDKIIAQQKEQLAVLGIHQEAAPAPARASKQAMAGVASAQIVSFGWGTL